MLDQRLQRWPNIKSKLVDHLSAGVALFYTQYCMITRLCDASQSIVLSIIHAFLLHDVYIYTQ